MAYAVTATKRMSNSGYHRNGKPSWWARVGDTFLTLPRVRGDEYLTFEVPSDLAPGTRIEFGAGKGPDGVRQFHIVKAQ